MILNTILDYCYRQVITGYYQYAYHRNISPSTPSNIISCPTTPNNKGSGTTRRGQLVMEGACHQAQCFGGGQIGCPGVGEVAGGHPRGDRISCREQELFCVIADSADAQDFVGSCFGDHLQRPASVVID